MTPIGHAIYLHGFASSPASSKAGRFAAELARHGVAMSAPDFNEPDFESLTVTRMLAQTADAIAAAPAAPVALIGSSLGAFVAVHAAAHDATARVDRLVLLAPAFDFGGNRLRQLGDHGIDEWRRAGRLRVFHYAHEQPRDVGFELYEDAARYDAYDVRLSQPALVFHGRKDETVPPPTVESWCSGRANVDLRMLDDEHQLAQSMDVIWTASATFFGLG
jgi:pimeloyl-ACP methyl ester carboxylesterase